MHNKQHGRCAICRKTESFINAKTGKKQKLSVDHDHGTGMVRGLLCVCCNRMLGYAKDDHMTLQRAIDYLKRCKGRVVRDSQSSSQRLSPR